MTRTRSRPHRSDGASRLRLPGERPAVGVPFTDTRAEAAGTALADAWAAALAAALVCLVVGTAVVVATGPTAVPATSLGALLGLVIVAGAGASLVHRPGRWSGPADRVTLARAVLIAGCATLAVPVLVGVLPARGWPLVALVVPTLALDAVDGAVARRTGTSSEAGRTLDGEMDAAILLVLSLAATRSLGWWVLGIGLMRYAFLVAGHARRSLQERLEFSQFRRVAAAAQGVSLAAGLTPAVPPAAATACVGLALALLTVSFGKDVVHLELRRRQRTRRIGASSG